ncbi:hypothetical protein TTHERM_00923200 (macronuclear) [Tetrahymena thermophila SB210]|uniref:Uncharacterized protein n=1 Tax=Tetrahymena thermophila (strain SB210) TaxID=312017 RepID=Q23WM5_TETTS|nr:hypothetical protein TTHERM_00923200 [Tetrahymena thermophila SB210]EAS00955.2 hypothetical protein TTHERM_00923200 [Tetrahymena thermophila SB210]|eukprot:XP_001021200.2 hypothetical protein TTHERM_00923200 [Tetrahymena thermophila SB210]
MVLKSQCFKDEDLVANIKSLLRTFANQIYQGKYDNFMKIRAQIYDFIQNIKLKLLNDNSFIDELFLKLFPRLITDLDINTNFIVKKKNIDSEHEQEDQEEEEHDQLEFVVLDIPLVNYKLKSIQLLGHFINQCPKIVIENKKFEIMTKIMKTLMNEREEYTVIHFNFKNLAKMFKCVRSYYLQYLPDLYLNNNEAVSEENKFLSEEAKVEYAPLFDFMLEQICSIEQLNYESEIEDLSYLIYKILKCTDNPTKRTFFQQIFQAIKYFMKKTKHILNTQIIEWSLAGLKLIYKAFPSQLQNNFLPIWKSLVSSLNQQKAPLNDSDEDSNDYNGDNDGDHSYSSEQQMEIQENSEQLEQGSINGSDNSYISLEEDEEGVNQISNEESQSQSNLQNEENKTQDQYIFKMLKIDITKIDIQLVSEIIGSVASFVKYDKCVYPIISDLINEIILNKKYIKIEMVQRNTFYYLNKITRYCFDSIQPDLFKKFYEIVKNTAESYQGYTDLNKKDIIENIYITYAFMTVKLVENKLPLEYTKSDYNCFNKLFSLVPFEGDYTEMQRVIKICNFLLEKNSSIIEQNLYNITLSVIYIIYDPSKYHVKSSKEQFYSEFYDKIVVKFPQAKSIAKSIIDLNKVFYCKYQSKN